jgi:rubrerythrin
MVAQNTIASKTIVQNNGRVIDEAIMVVATSKEREPQRWVCEVCGMIHTEIQPLVCDSCGATSAIVQKPDQHIEMSPVR